ncbi:hypothetical protein [Kitasatospora sp. NBC_01266]|uniref:hypothetical protein n=1 Tax=Kitasatospora sp. NBC_01266 TaxID=2903572 RepID=UPI002E3319A3|nr:hypothetical protein [Kitasatospora sp. NBC_01266]
MADERTTGAEATGPKLGSTRHTLVVLCQLVPIALVLAGLVGGVPGLGAAAALLAATALLTARYVAGAGSETSGWRRRQRLMGTQDPNLADWRYTVRNGLDVKDFPHPLRGRLRRLYAARLAERHSVSLATEPERAAALVGPEVWAFLDPRHPRAEDVLSPAELNVLIDRLETL